MKKHKFLIFSLFAVICLTILAVDFLDDGGLFFDNLGHASDPHDIEIAQKEYRRFSNIQLGNSCEGVQEIMHSCGRLIHTNKIGMVKEYTYVWTDDEIKITCSFRDDKLYAKSINGFDICELWPHNKKIKFDAEAYEQIKMGMSYEEVEKLLSNRGLLISKSEYGDGRITQLYSWENQKHERVNVMFVDGHVSNKWQFGLEKSSSSN